jgi:glycosyltransferase involved in cell wall biosynthesis
MYPTNKYPFDGIFIKEQIENLHSGCEFKHKIYLIESVHKSKFEYIKSIFKIPQNIKHYKPDIIHVHYGISGLFLLIFRPKVKIYLTLHGSDFNNRGSNYLQVWLSRKIISKVDIVIVQNWAMKKQALLYNNNVHVLTCGVDTEFFKPEKIKKINIKEKIILFPSSPLRNVKNYPLFLEVVMELKEVHNYTIKIRNLENVTRIQVKKILNQSDCLLMTSLTEGSPQVVKESLSCGLPVVSVPVGDVSEMIKEVPNCFISSSHDAKELAKLVVKTFKNDKKEIRKAFLIKKQYSNAIIAERLATLYGLNIKLNS